MAAGVMPARRRLRSRLQAVGLVTFGALIGAGGLVALDQTARSNIDAIAPYDNCRDAIQAGAAPLHRGDPGYSPRLDPDDNGIACEPYRKR